MDVGSSLKRWAESKDPAKLSKKRAKADEAMSEGHRLAAQYKEDKASKAFAKAAKLYNDAGFPAEAEKARSLSESYAADVASAKRIEDHSLGEKVRERMRESTAAPKGAKAPLSPAAVKSIQKAASAKVRTGK